ncbi:MAG: hypothetical protein HQK99_14415 [Nitrospirae bacterium]|nr:hypothetical protein [Nitrospirota bacterium]
MKYLHEEYKSPLGDIIVKHFSDDKSDIMKSEVWLYSANNPSKKVFLYSYDIYARILFSHDEKWLVLNNMYGSSGKDAILFREVEGLKYEEIENLYDKAWELFEKTHKKYKAHVFKKYKRNLIPFNDHSYAEAVLWSSDSKSVLIEIYGHHDEIPVRLEPWYCIYDVTTGKMTLDFNSVFNRDTFHPNGTAKGRELYIY